MVTCVGRDVWQPQRYSLPFPVLDDMAADCLSAQLFKVLLHSVAYKQVHLAKRARLSRFMIARSKKIISQRWFLYILVDNNMRHS